MPNPEDLTDPTTSMNMALALMAKAFKLNYSTPTNNNQRISSNPRNMQIAQPGNGNQNQIGNGNLVAVRAEGNAAGPRRMDVAYLQTQLLIAQKEEAGIQLQAEEYDLMQASTSGTQTDSTPVYDSDGLAEVHENCDNNEIFNMFTQEEQYTELLEPIPEPQRVSQNNNNVISEDTSVEQGGETVEQHSVNFEETRALYESLYHNLAIKVEKVNSVNRKLKETNADLTTELARYKNQERCFEISQEKYDKLERKAKRTKREKRDKAVQSKLPDVVHTKAPAHEEVLRESLSSNIAERVKTKSSVSKQHHCSNKLACTPEIAEDFDTCRFNLGRISLTGFPAQSIRSSNAIALDSPYLLVLVIKTSQSRQHELFDVDSGRISIHHCYHRDNA
nr:hypothetical protein [Tanacetum cinerariifolium]